ncbi:helix-turn-helix domain-containing protein [bacterium]|nr:helix-turn-helix domain-containing protein [bacterium]
MPDMIDKRDRAALFRDRLALAMTEAGATQASLARSAGLDRSTISALLASGTRLPNAQAAADCAMSLGVSTDWLLGLTDRPAPPDRLADEAVTLVHAPRALFDDTIFGWHRAAAGAKIRHVPATLPDILKTPEVAAWEYSAALGVETARALETFEAQRAWLAAAHSDFEIAMPRHELDSLAAGTGYWAGLPAALRRAQIDELARLTETLYPALRLYLFDAHRVFSAPVTVFGSERAVVYLGRQYFVFSDPAKVAEVSRHFDWLVRETSHSARGTAALLHGLTV